MNFSSTSQYMLKYQKAKAKLVEYDVDQDDYPKFRLNSNELSYPTIYIISRYAEGIIEDNVEVCNEFAPYLINASQYFDAAVNSRDREAYHYDFLLSGATAYFLSDDLGSAKVLCSKIIFNKNNANETPQMLLIYLFNFALRNIMVPHSKSKSTFANILNFLNEYFRSGNLVGNENELLLQYRKEIYENYSPIDIYYVDILIAVTMECIKKSAWALLPEYSGVSKKIWGEYLKKPSATKILWPSQELICKKGILDGSNAIIQLPTGVGKTKSIELIIRSAFLANRASTAIIVAPLRALCNEITNDMNQAFGNEVIINQFSDVLQEDFSFDLSDLFQKRIITCTPEKLSYIMHHQEDIIDEIDLFVFDEGHMFDDGSRGASYELLISEIREKISAEKQFVLLSAVLSNAEQIKNWLFKNAGVLASSERIKATPKSIGFSSQSKDINYYSDDANESDYYIPKSIETVELNNFKGERAVRIFPIMTDAKDIAIYYAIKLCGNGGVAIYVNRTDSVLTVIKRVLELHKREYNLARLMELTNIEQAEKIQNLIKAYYGENHEYSQGALLGIFPHYADLPNGIKLAIEYAIRHNHIRFVVCTSTLAQGVNIPIKYLFMTSFRLSKNSMQIRSFQNLIGRTARSGMYTEGSIVVTDPKFYDQKTDRKHGGIYRWNDCIRMFDPNSAEPCSSSILSVVKDIEVDYEITLSGRTISEHIIDNYEKTDCFSSLIGRLVSWYLENYPGKDRSTGISAINLRQSIVESIENHLCFVFSRYEKTDYQENAIRICRETLAYTLATEEEKDQLIKLFTVIAKRIQSIGDSIKIQTYARTMVGIDLSRKIEDWIEHKAITCTSYTKEQILDMVISFFIQTHNTKISPEQFSSLSKLWISGKTFIEISHDTDLSINSIEEVCSKSISYQLSFFIGNIVDILCIDTDNEDAINSHFLFCTLQKRLKYGVSSGTAVSICESVFNDRLLAEAISEIIGIETQEADIIDLIKYHADKILSMLVPFPDFFSDRINMLIDR
ncbi:MAG: DEAD/DEAH box helicase [Candidatus Limiplasma sp.]|nr:DEAD/DEAH box helicase [Candidatus Limiplasma sp.]